MDGLYWSKCLVPLLKLLVKSDISIFPGFGELDFFTALQLSLRETLSSSDNKVYWAENMDNIDKEALILILGEK